MPQWAFLKKFTQLTFHRYRSYQSFLAMILVCISFTNTVFGARFENLSIKHGLSQNTIFDITQDQSGYIWLATNDGLNRYDGKQFVVFSSTKSESESVIPILPNEAIYDIEVDAKNNLWVATFNGLAYLNPISHEVKTFLHLPNDSESLSNNTIRRIMLDADHNLWVATSNGLNKLNTITQTFTRYIHENGAESGCSSLLRALTIDRRGQIWIGGSNGKVCTFDPKQERFSIVNYRNDFEKSTRLRIREIFEDSDGIIWIGSVNGLFRYEPETGKSTSLFHQHEDQRTQVALDWIQRITEYENRYLWIATTGGIAHYDKKTGELKHFVYDKYAKSGLSWVEYYSIFIDRSGLIWLGSSGSGVDKFNPKQDFFGLIDDYGKPDYTLASPSVWGIHNAYGYIWIATANGLHRYDMQSRKIKAYFHDPNNPKSLSHNHINYITTGNYRDLWLTTQNGLSHFDPDTETFENFFQDGQTTNLLPRNTFTQVIKDKNGLLWISVYQSGVFVFDPESKKMIRRFEPNSNDPNSLRGTHVFTIQQTADGLIWLGNENELDFFDPGTNTLHHYHFDNVGQKNIRTGVNALREALDHQLLIGTSTGLLVHNRKTNKTLKFDMQDGMSNDFIYRLEQDKQGHVWASTNRGLSKINLETREVQNFDVADGLQGYEFNAGASFNDGEYLYFGGYNGVSFFKPENIRIDSFIPPIVISSFKVNGQRLKNLNPKAPIHLHYSGNYFAIEFSALDFSNPEKNQYAYKLEGFDPGWIYSGNRSFASYTNLDGGTYQFRVKGSNKYGQWNEEGISLSIEIEDPPWGRWWAYLIYLIVILAIFFFIARFKSISDSRLLADKIRRMTTNLTQTLDLTTIQTQMAQHLQQILPYQRILFFLKYDKDFRDGFEACNTDKNQYPFPTELKQKILEYIEKTNRPLHLETIKDYNVLNINATSPLSVNIFCLPLITRQNMVGIIILINPKQQSFDKGNIDIAVTLSSQASAAIDNARLFAETKHLFEETRQLAFYDTLTGLENRQLFKDRLEQSLKMVRRNKTGIALFFLDLDQFKQINDTLGHDAGDTLLIEIGMRLKNCVRAQDTVARIGGDEFIILLNNVNEVNSISVIAEKILKAFESPVLINNQTIKTSTSIGISLAPKDSMDASTLMKNADMAMYSAKEQGRNNYKFFTEEMNIQLTEHLSIKNDMKIALEQSHFQLYYQPIYNMANFNIDSAEGLIRWVHPQKGMIWPDIFIPRAEETHLINDIGRWVFSESCRHLQFMEKEYQQKITLSTNLSMNQIIYDTHLIASMAETMNHYRIDPTQVKLEITESIFVKNYEKTIKILHKLRDIGISLAIDDFGTGYSSLSYLKQLPIDLIKIDRSFISDLPHDTEDGEITAAIIAMAHKLHLKVVAEGVETREQLMFLEKNSCDFVQGYFFSKPLPFEQFTDYMEHHTIKKLSVAE